MQQELLQTKLQILSPIKWKNLNESDQKNPRRLLRSIELVFMNPRLPSPDGEANGGQAYIKTIKNLKFKIKNYNLLKIGLTAPREVLKKRIFDRLLSRFNDGLVEEAINLHKNTVLFRLPQVKKGITVPANIQS